LRAGDVSFGFFNCKCIIVWPKGNYAMTSAMAARSRWINAKPVVALKANAHFPTESDGLRGYRQLLQIDKRALFCSSKLEAPFPGKITAKLQDRFAINL
jgi:hypothetical protein